MPKGHVASGTIQIWCHGEFLSRTPTGGNVWVCDPTVSGICVDVCGSFCHGDHADSQGAGLPPVTMLVCEGHAATEAMLIRVACTPTKGHGDI